MILSIKPVWNTKPIQICKENTLVCHGASLMQAIQLDQTLTKWEKNMKLQKIQDHFTKHIMATKIQSKVTKKEWINIQVRNQPLFIHRWEAMDLHSINILEVLVKTRLKIKSMISLQWLLEQRIWKEQSNLIMENLPMEVLGNIQNLTWR